MAETHAERAYAHLRGKLLSGDLEPGSRIRYGAVGREIGVSATPVREAIGRLANEGLVDLVPQLGAVVRRMSREELRELYEMREALEPYAAGRAAERIGPGQKAELRAQVDRMKRLADEVRRSGGKPPNRGVIARFEWADLAVHMLIIEATGNRAMIRSVSTSRVLTRVFSTDRHAYDASVMAATVRDHRRILSAIERGDRAGAREAMAAHIRNGLERTLAAGVGSDPDRWWR